MDAIARALQGGMIMREILFRGKPVERFLTQMRITNQWDENGFVYGSLIVSEDRCYICTYAECTMNTIIGNGHATMVEVIPETVGQFTGLKDKNGKKIFEGDILKVAISETAKDEKGHRYYKGNKKFVYWSVEWVNFVNYLGWRVYGTNRRFNSKLSCSLLANCYAEVIGNIHDNPELLKGEEK